MFHRCEKRMQCRGCAEGDFWWILMHPANTILVYIHWACFSAKAFFCVSPSKVGSSFLWHENCREHRGTDSGSTVRICQGQSCEPYKLQQGCAYSPDLWWFMHCALLQGSDILYSVLRVPAVPASEKNRQWFIQWIQQKHDLSTVFSVLNDANVKTKVLERVGTVIQLKRFQKRHYHTSTVPGCTHHTVPYCAKTCCSIMLQNFLLDVSVFAASRCFCSCSCSCCCCSRSCSFSGAGGGSQWGNVGAVAIMLTLHIFHNISNDYALWCIMACANYYYDFLCIMIMWHHVLIDLPL